MNQASYPVAAAAAVTSTVALPSPDADAVMVEWLPVLVCPSATVACCGLFQSEGVKVSAWPSDTVVPVPASFRCTVTSLLGALDNETPSEVLWPCWTVSEDWPVTTLGFSTWMATGSEVVLVPAWSVITSVSEKSPAGTLAHFTVQGADLASPTRTLLLRLLLA